jgi:TRAP-type C4-dicarboxylate transport system permease small subunit
MAEATSEAATAEGRGAPPHDPLGRALFRLSETVAVLGGVVLLLVMALTFGSVVGRGAFNSPLLGDSEIVEIGCAIAIFAFLPYCQMRGANVIVDFFTAGASRRARAILDTVMHLVFLVCVVVLTWRLAIGGVGAFRSGDNSMFLRIPQWWGYLSAFIFSAVWCLSCLHSVLRHSRGILRAGRAGEMK